MYISNIRKTHTHVSTCMCMEKFLDRTKYFHVNEYATYCELNISLYLTCDEYIYINATILIRHTVLILMCTKLAYTNYFSHKHVRLMGFDITSNTGEKPINISAVVQITIIFLQKCICDLTGEKTYHFKCYRKYYSDMGWHNVNFLMTLYQFNYLYYNLSLFTGEYTCTTYINVRNGIVTYSIYHYAE